MTQDKIAELCNNYYMNKERVKTIVMTVKNIKHLG